MVNIEPVHGRLENLDLRTSTKKNLRTISESVSKLLKQKRFTKRNSKTVFFLRVHTRMVKNKYIIRNNKYMYIILNYIIYRGSSSQLCIYELHLDLYHACWMSSLCFVIFAHDTQPISWNQPTTLQTKKHVEPMNLPSWIMGYKPLQTCLKFQAKARVMLGSSVSYI